MTPDHPDYDAFRATFNGILDKRPVQINVCSSVDAVVAGVRAAQEMGVPISVRGGGHAVSGHCVGDGALVIDLRGMRQVDVNPESRTAVAQGGATWEDYDTATQRFGLASTGGTFVDTGIAGLTLGGGIGYLQGTQGFAVDALIGVRVVTADGQLVSASAEENPDLFWAVRGAGPNFGVVVDFTYRLQPVEEVYGGSISYPLSSAADVLRVMRDIAESAPDELMLVCAIGRRTGNTVAIVCFQGSPVEGERVIRPLREAGTIDADAVRPLSYLEMQADSELLPFGLRHYWKGHFVRSVPDDLIDASAAHVMARPSNGFGTLLVEFINGAPRRVPVESMAFNERRAVANASALGIWPSPQDDQAHITWSREFAAMAAPYATQTEYMNYMTADTGTDRIRSAFGDSKYERLRELKRRYDPENVFCFNHNIPPAE